MTTVYLLRHSEPLKINNIENSDSLQLQNEKWGLTINGENIAKEKSKNSELQDFDIVFSSNYVRAIATAKYFTNDKINVVESFGERKFGIDNWNELPDDFSKKQYEDFDYKFFEQQDIDKKKVFCEKLEIAKRDAVVSCFNYCKTSVTYKVDDNSRDSYPKRDEKWGGKGECLIMNAYLKTQYIGARLEQGPICGNSFPRDLLVSKVVQKAIDAVLSEPTDNDTGIVSETKDVMKDVDQGARLSLLESIQKNAESAEFFSLPLFIRMFQKIDQNQPCFFGSCVFFALTYLTYMTHIFDWSLWKVLTYVQSIQASIL